MTRVLLVGNATFFHVGACFQRALAELGHPHALVDESAGAMPPGTPWAVGAAARLVGYRAWLRRRLNGTILETARAFKPDVVIVLGGSYMIPAVLTRLKAETGATLVCYALDDPFNPAHRTRRFIDGIPRYDLYATVRRSNLADLAAAGARRTVQIMCGYDPSIHFPESPATPEERGGFGADVVFAGGADRDRYPLLRRLAAEPGIRLRLYGGYWDRDPVLRPLHRGFAYGRDYRLAVGGAKIALCLVRKANRDGHVMRTFEIPAMGGFLLADRTEEHRETYAEDREAVFYADETELLDKLRFYLGNDDARMKIAEAGRARITSGANTWKDRVVELLARASAAT